MDPQRYLEIIKVPFIVLLALNFLYYSWGYPVFSFFSQGIPSFSFFGITSFLALVLVYSYVTWRVIKENGSTATESAIAGAFLSISVSLVSYLIGFVATSLALSFDIAPGSVLLLTLRAQFEGEYFNILIMLRGMIFGVILSAVGGFFGFTWEKIIARKTLPVFEQVAKPLMKKGAGGKLWKIGQYIRKEDNKSKKESKNAGKHPGSAR
jgi:hypothetical protein